MRAFYFCGPLAFAIPLCAQLPSAEDLETKSKRGSFQEGLEMREVKESSAKDVGEALSKIDGIWKLRKGGIANDVVLRGFQGANLNVLLDGIRIYGACPGHMDPAAFHVDFAEVERIEVVKGGYDVANQGSLGGSVNVIRKRGMTGFRLSPGVNLGSWGAVNPSIHAAAGNERVEVSGGYSYRRADPFRDGRGVRMTDLGGYRPESKSDSAYDIHTGWGTLRFSPAAKQSAEVSYAHQSGSNVLYPYLLMDSPYDTADRIDARYAFRELAGGIRSVRLQGYYTKVDHWMTDEKRTSSIGARDTFSMATWAGTRASGGRADAETAHGLSFGFESYQRNWNAVNSMRSRMMVSDQNVIPNVNTTVAGAYVDFNRALTDRLRIGGGARIDAAKMYVRAAADEAIYLAYKGDARLENRDVNPSANGRVTVGLRSDLELFAGMALTARLPDAQERYFAQRRQGGSDWVGDPAIEPVRNLESTIGLNFRRGRLFVKPLAFYSSLGDFIVVHNQPRMQPVAGVMNRTARSYDNVDARIYGGEITAGAGIGSRWLVSSGLSMSRGSKDPRPEIGIRDSNLAEMTPLRGRASVRHGRKIWFLEAEGIAANAQRRVDTDLRETPTAGYFTAALRGGVHLGRWSLTLGAENLLDRYYYEPLSYQRDPFRSGIRVPEPGRNVYANLSWSY
jgi:iron complex outermembrane receptor protein